MEQMLWYVWQMPTISSVSTSKAFDTACCPAPVPPGVVEFVRMHPRLAEVRQVADELG